MNGASEFVKSSPSLVCSDQCAADVVFVVDESGSIGQYYFDNMKQYLVDVITQLNPSRDGHHVGGVTFADRANLQFYLDYQDIPGKVCANVHAWMGEYGTRGPSTAMVFEAVRFSQGMQDFF